MKNPRQCVITLGIDDQPPPGHPQLVRDFRPAIKRLEASLVRTGFEGDFVHWDESYPMGSPTHHDSPCGFKPFCFIAAAEAGYEIILWLDATVEVQRPLMPLLHRIEREGYLIFREDHSVGEYCKDDALGPLGITRETSMIMPSCWGCAIGLDLRQTRAQYFLKEWQALAVDGITFPGPRWSGVRGFPLTASKDSRVKGHRYDQTAASVLALRHGMNVWQSKGLFFHFLSNHRRSVPTRLSRPIQIVPSPRINDPSERRASNGRHRILFFSRGRGRGHAVPDLAIVEELYKLEADMTVQFVSYGTGADTLREAGWPVIDLGLPERNPFVRTLTETHQLIEDWRPTIVISHEEFAVTASARLANVSSILITDWFPPATTIPAEAIGCADSIVFIGESTVFQIPASLRRPPIFVGPVVRKMNYSRDDRIRARRELNVSSTAFMISVIPGAWATETKAPIAQLVLQAFDTLATPDKFLYWLSKRDHDSLRRVTAGRPNVQVAEDCHAVDQILVASDVVITKGNRGTIMDAASLGIPSIALSYRNNPVDDALVPLIPSTKTFVAKSLNPELLHAHLAYLAAMSPAARARPLNWHLRGGEVAAAALMGEIRRLTPAFTSRPAALTDS
jgi:hypothetical protein